MTRSAKLLTATAIAGTLDILAAIGLTLLYGRKVDAMLRYVASGPVPAARDWGAAGAALGLAVHFALMAAMAAVFVVAANRISVLKRQWLRWGIAYGLITWAVMNLAVVPLRFGTTPSVTGMVTQLFCHIVLVAIPIAWIAHR